MSKIFNLLNVKCNTIEMLLKFFFTSFHSFLPHEIDATFRLKHEKHETSKRTVQYVLKVIVRDTTKSLLKQIWAKLFHSLINWDEVINCLGVNQRKYGWIKVVNFTIDQWNHGCRIMIWKCIQHIMKKKYVCCWKIC